MMHLSDSLRSALLYKNGGFYCDMDAITLKDLRFIHAIFFYPVFLDAIASLDLGYKTKSV